MGAGPSKLIEKGRSEMESTEGGADAPELAEVEGNGSRMVVCANGLDMIGGLSLLGCCGETRASEKEEDVRKLDASERLKRASRDSAHSSLRENHDRTFEHLLLSRKPSRVNELSRPCSALTSAMARTALFGRTAIVKHCEDWN